MLVDQSVNSNALILEQRANVDSVTRSDPGSRLPGSSDIDRHIALNLIAHLSHQSAGGAYLDSSASFSEEEFYLVCFQKISNDVLPSLVATEHQLSWASCQVGLDASF